MTMGGEVLLVCFFFHSAGVTVAERQCPERRQWASPPTWKYCTMPDVRIYSFNTVTSNDKLNGTSDYNLALQL